MTTSWKRDPAYQSLTRRERSIVRRRLLKRWFFDKKIAWPFVKLCALYSVTDGILDALSRLSRAFHILSLVVSTLFGVAIWVMMDRAFASWLDEEVKVVRSQFQPQGHGDNDVAEASPSPGA